MSVINSFATSGFWNYRNVIVPAVVTIPLVIEGAILVRNFYQKPHIIKEKLTQAKKTVIQSFTIQVGEGRSDGIRRIAINFLMLLGCLALMSAAAYGAAVLLPCMCAITTAVSAIFVIGQVFLNAKRYKQQLIGAFTIKEGENPITEKRRIRKNVLKAAAVGLFAIGFIAMAHCIFIPLISKGFSWNLFHSLPCQTPAAAFAAYAGLGMVHGGMALDKWKKGDRMGVCVHIFAAALAFMFPTYYLWHGNLRLHHSFTGLALMAAPSRSLQFLGGVMTFDSSLYAISPFRGYVTGIDHHQYDFMNSVVEHYPLFHAAYTGAIITQSANDSLEEKPPLSAVV